MTYIYGQFCSGRTPGRPEINIKNDWRGADGGASYIVINIHKEKNMLKILTGLISGIVSGTGMGGGTILILILSLFMGVDQHIAQATNLVFFVPTSITAIIVSIKEKLIDWNLGLWLATAGIVGAILGAKISVKMNVEILRKLFGGFLGAIAIYEIYSLIKEYRNNKKTDNK